MNHALSLLLLTFWFIVRYPRTSSTSTTWSHDPREAQMGVKSVWGVRESDPAWQVLVMRATEIKAR